LLGPARLRQLAGRLQTFSWLRLLQTRFSAAGAVLLACLAAGCSGLTDEPTAGDRVGAEVTKHTDGDTLWLSGIGKVRLIGIDTPEVYGSVECFGRRASTFVERTAPLGATVRYRLGVDERDRYGRALAYVWLADGRFLNRLLVARGYAQPLTVPPNVEYEDVFVRASHGAREAGRGLWGRLGCSG
jgi:micrococcal nuclease